MNQASKKTIFNFLPLMLFAFLFFLMCNQHTLFISWSNQLLYIVFLVLTDLTITALSVFPQKALNFSKKKMKKTTLIVFFCSLLLNVGVLFLLNNIINLKNYLANGIILILFIAFAFLCLVLFYAKEWKNIISSFKSDAFISVLCIAVVAILAVFAGSVNVIKKESINTKVWFEGLDYSNTENTVYGGEYILDGNAKGKDGYVVEFEKEPGKDFVVLNLTDIQKMDIEYILGRTKITKETIDKLVEEVKPDLITLSGDNVSGTNADGAQRKLIKILDSYKIPWAPDFGNHDGEDISSTNDILGNIFLNESEYCVFKKGPSNIEGIGNYVINITENGHTVHTLFMMDSHRNDSVLKTDGTVENGAYSSMGQNQMNWYQWVIEGIAKEEGHVVESTCIFHIPLYEYRIAMNDDMDDIQEGAGCGAPRVNNGFFDLMKKLGSTKQVIAGHDHNNCAIIDYQGITLAYALKTGDGCYWLDRMNGGTVVTIGDKVTVEHHYIAVK